MEATSAEERVCRLLRHKRPASAVEEHACKTDAVLSKDCFNSTSLPPMSSFAPTFPMPDFSAHHASTPLRELIFAEKKVLDTLRTLSVDSEKAADALRVWAKNEQGDQKEIMIASSRILLLYSNAIAQSASQGFSTHEGLAAIQAREGEIANLNEELGSLRFKAGELGERHQRMHPWNPNRHNLEQSIDDLYMDMAVTDSVIMSKEAALREFKDATIQAWLSSKFSSISESSERGMIAAKYGHQIVSEAHQDNKIGHHASRDRLTIESLLNEATQSLMHVEVGGTSSLQQTHNPSLPPVTPRLPPRLPLRPTTPLRVNTVPQRDPLHRPDPPQRHATAPSDYLLTSTAGQADIGLHPSFTPLAGDSSNEQLKSTRSNFPMTASPRPKSRHYTSPLPPFQQSEEQFTQVAPIASHPNPSSTLPETQAQSPLQRFQESGRDEQDHTRMLLSPPQPSSPYFQTLSPGSNRLSFGIQRETSDATHSLLSAISDDMRSPFLPVIGQTPSSSLSPDLPTGPAADYFRDDPAPGRTDDPPIDKPSDIAQNITSDDIKMERSREAVLSEQVERKLTESASSSSSPLEGSCAAEVTTAQPPQDTQETGGDPTTHDCIASVAAQERLSTGVLHQTEKEPTIASSIGNSTIRAHNNVTISTAGRDVHVYNGTNMKDLDKEILDVLNWISTIDSKAMQADILQQVAPGTGKWFLTGTQYLSWLDKSSTLIWGAGSAGAGKTCLSSIVIDNLEGLSNAIASATVIYVYCRYDEHLTVTQILATLLRQLAENCERILDEIKEKLYAPHVRRGRKPSQTDIKKALLDGLKSFSTTYIVVDALDELDTQVRHELLRILESEIRAPILLTSRLTDLPGGRSPDFEIRASKEDFHTLVRHEISEIGRLRTPLSKRADSNVILDEVASKIEQSSDGLLLIAAFQVASLKESITVKDLREAADRLPRTDINKMYRMIMKRVRDQDPAKARVAYRAIGWVLFSVRPLKMQELREAVAMEPGSQAALDHWEDALIEPDTLLALSCGLLTFGRATETVRLLHITAHDFFDESEEKEELGGQFPDPPHRILAEACASYIEFTLGGERLRQEQLQNAFSKRPFLEHACRFVGSYIRLTMAEADASDGDDEVKVIHYVPEPLRRCRSIPLLAGLGRPVVDQGSLIHLAASHGLAFLLNWMLTTNNGAIHVNEESEEGMTPLIYAAIGGQLPCLRRLLGEKNIDVHHKARSGHTALVTAALAGQMKAQELLHDDHRNRAH